MNTPVRKIKKSAVKNIIRFPSIKANGDPTILVESILEPKYCLHMEFGSNVEMYIFFCPVNLRFHEDEENTCIPDVEAHYVCGVWDY